MPMSENYTARVLVVTGQLFEPFANGAPVNVLSNDSLRLATRSDDIYAIAKTITKDQFWNALFDQAVVDANGGFELIPRVGAQTIRIGDGADLPRCLNKLMTFYHGGMPQADWRKYSVIDLRFADQIVCTRRGDAGVAPVTNRVTQASPRQPMR